MWGIVCIIVVIIGAFLFYASYNISSGVYVKTLCKNDTTEKVIALTFDDGPDTRFTPQVLDVLKQYDVRATFFCVGEKAEANPGLIKRIQNEGHLIGNHSYSHRAIFPLFTQRKMIAELEHTRLILEKLSGEKIRFFRPPFGVTNPTVGSVIRELDYIPVGWSIRSFDTKGEPVDKVLDRIIKQITPGAVILLHDRMPDCAVLTTRLLDYLQANQYKAIRIDDLFEPKKR